MNAMKTVLIPALLALTAGVAMATDAPADAKLGAKEAAAAASAPAKKHHAHKAKAKADASAAAASGTTK